MPLVLVAELARVPKRLGTITAPNSCEFGYNPAQIRCTLKRAVVFAAGRRPARTEAVVVGAGRRSARRGGRAAGSRGARRVAHQAEELLQPDRLDVELLGLLDDRARRTDSVGLGGR